MRDVVVTVSTKSEDSMIVSWELVGKGIQRTKLQVLRSESRFGPFEPVCDQFGAEKTGTFTDTTPRFDIRRRWYYKIRVFRAGTNVGEYPLGVEAASNERRDDPLARSMAHDNELRYRIHGDPVIYFPIRSYGMRCSKCWDSITEDRVMSNCEACYDTTFSGGFLTPVKIWMMVENRQTFAAAKAIPGPATSATVATARFPWFVDLKPNDVIVEEDNTRWRICEPIQVVRKRKCAIYHFAGLARIPNGSIEYRLQVPDTIAEKRKGWSYTPSFLR